MGTIQVSHAQPSHALGSEKLLVYLDLCAYGRKDNNEQQLLECDRGTVMMARSIQMARGGKVSFITHRAKGKENPPQSDLQEHISAWGMAEVIGYLRRSRSPCSTLVHRARGDRHWKPHALRHRTESASAGTANGGGRRSRRSLGSTRGSCVTATPTSSWTTSRRWPLPNSRLKEEDQGQR